MPGLRATLHEFAQGQLHSGSKEGPTVTNPKQAIAIGLNDTPKKKKGGKFKHHHKHAGEAHARGDHATAMKHVGGMLAALKSGRPDDEMPEEPSMSEELPEARPSMRDRMAAFRNG